MKDNLFEIAVYMNTYIHGLTFRRKKLNWRYIYFFQQYKILSYCDPVVLKISGYHITIILCELQSIRKLFIGRNETFWFE